MAEVDEATLRNRDQRWLGTCVLLALDAYSTGEKRADCFDGEDSRSARLAALLGHGDRPGLRREKGAAL